jgi:hypothetical protein
MTRSSRLGGTAGGDGRARTVGGGLGGVVMTAAEEFCVVVAVVVGVLCAGVCAGAVRVDALALREDLVARGQTLRVEKQWTAAWRVGEHTPHPACEGGSKSQMICQPHKASCRNLPSDQPCIFARVSHIQINK